MNSTFAVVHGSIIVAPFMPSFDAAVSWAKDRLASAPGEKLVICKFIAEVKGVFVTADVKVYE